MSRGKDNELKIMVIGIILVIVVYLVSFVGHAYFEARAYERVTGKKVSTWDAMFLQLRVQGD